MDEFKIDVYFLSIDLNNFRCFKDKQTLDFSDGKGRPKKWTIILGDNGTGKTSLLQLIAGFEMKEEVIEGRKLLRPVGLWSFKGGWSESVDEMGVGTASAGLTCYYGQDGEIRWKPTLSLTNGLNTAVSTNSNSVLRNLICYGYGANRFMSFNSLSESETKNSDTLFDVDAKLINAEEWLLRLDYAASKVSDVQQFVVKKRSQVEEILKELLPDIETIRFSTPTRENLKPSVEFKTPYGWVTIHQLSLGYKTMVAWIVDLAARLFDRYPESENPLTEPAIVLVDEIDLHLHPKWQRKIFDYLSNLFPNTQFIVTAHSPLVVQSAPKDANIVLLRREGDHVVIDQNIESVNAWRLDQILTSDLFGLESARGPEITKVLEERKELLQKVKLTPEEETRLKELNRIVHNLPTAESEEDRKAMEIIRKAAEFVKNK